MSLLILSIGTLNFSRFSFSYFFPLDSLSKKESASSIIFNLNKLIIISRNSAPFLFANSSTSPCLTKTVFMACSEEISKNFSVLNLLTSW